MAHNAPLEWTVQFSQGFSVHIRPDNLVINFSLPVSVNRVRPLPELQIPEVVPYSALIASMVTYLTPLVSSLAATAPLRVSRLGVMATSDMPLGDLPPGGTALFDNLARPFPSGLEQLEVRMTAPLRVSEDERIRCHHILKCPETHRDTLAELRLDWQHLFVVPLELRPRDVAHFFNEAVESAMGYFQRFGEGDFGNGV